MTNKHKTKKKRASYCSIAEFEQDFFPKSFAEKQARKPQDSQSIGVSLAKESFRRIRQEAIADKPSTGK
jgi:hypothetical protein